MFDPTSEWYGFDLMEAARVSSGTLYPILHRLVGDGWLERIGDSPSDRGGTARRMYRLTGVGIRSADALLAARARAPRHQPIRRPQLGGVTA
jgi:DNA-binding PadR family transcriptional regulator